MLPHIGAKSVQAPGRFPLHVAAEVRWRTDRAGAAEYHAHMKSSLLLASARSGRALAWLVGTCLLALSVPAAAFDSRGARSCEEWQQRRLEAIEGHKLDAGIIQTWLVGYLSGLVAGSGMDFLVGTKNPLLFSMADELCQRYPQADLAFVGTAIARDLMQQKSIVNVPTLP